MQYVYLREENGDLRAAIAFETKEVATPIPTPQRTVVYGWAVRKAYDEVSKDFLRDIAAGRTITRPHRLHNVPVGAEKLTIMFALAHPCNCVPRVLEKLAKKFLVEYEQNKFDKIETKEGRPRREFIDRLLRLGKPGRPERPETNDRPGANRRLQCHNDRWNRRRIHEGRLARTADET